MLVGLPRGDYHPVSQHCHLTVQDHLFPDQAMSLLIWTMIHQEPCYRDMCSTVSVHATVDIIQGSRPTFRLTFVVMFVCLYDSVHATQKLGRIMHIIWKKYGLYLAFKYAECMFGISLVCALSYKITSIFC